MGVSGSAPCGADSSSDESSSESSFESCDSDGSEEEQPRPRASKSLRDWKVTQKREEGWASCCGCIADAPCFADIGFKGTRSLRVRHIPSSTDHPKALFPDNTALSIDDYFKVNWKKEIGAGGYAAVYTGSHKATKEEKAIKVIQKSMIADPDRLKQEIEFAMRMDHPNIARLQQTFEDRRYVYIVMEFCQGGELFELVERQKFVNEKHAAIIMQQIFRAVNYMHTEGVCHRDLKPENFLFLTRGPIEGNTLKVIDFGVSAAFRSEGFRTRTGTPFYVAPEVLEQPRYGPQCDLWSCGVVMFVLLSGQAPFRGQNDQETLAKVKAAKVRFQGETWKMVSSDAKALIHHLLEKSPAQRFTAEQALNNRWVKDHAPSSTGVPLHASVVESLREFGSLNRFKKAALHAVARQLADAEISKLKDIFTTLDEDGNGSISSGELIEGLRRANIDSLAGVDLESLVQGLDVDGSGVIDYSEFLAATLDRRHYVSERLCWNAFRVFDKNGDGSISRDELVQVLRSFDATDLSEDAVNAVMREVDVNGDGEIDFEEFLAMMNTLGKA